MKAGRRASDVGSGACRSRDERSEVRSLRSSRHFASTSRLHQSHHAAVNEVRRPTRPSCEHMQISKTPSKNRNEEWRRIVPPRERRKITNRYGGIPRSEATRREQSRLISDEIAKYFSCSQSSNQSLSSFSIQSGFPRNSTKDDTLRYQDHFGYCLSMVGKVDPVTFISY